MTGWAPTWRGRVEPDWLDELGHVSFLVYQRIADKGAGAFWADMWGGRGPSGRDGVEYIIVETHVRYLSELRLGDPVTIDTALLAWDDKRYQLLHRIRSGERLACLVETVNMAFDLGTRRTMTFPAEVRAALAARGPKPDDARAELPLKRSRNET